MAAWREQETAQGTSAANAAVTVTVDAATDQNHLVWGYLVVLRAADAANDAEIKIQHGPTPTVVWRDYIGNTEKRGTVHGMAFNKPIRCPKGEKLELVVAAAGADAITEANLQYETR